MSGYEGIKILLIKDYLRPITATNDEWLIAQQYSLIMCKLNKIILYQNGTPR